jgi:hypothetical protein
MRASRGNKAPAEQNHPLSYTEEVPVATTSPPLATLLAFHSLTQIPAPAVLHAASQTAGMTGLITVIAIGAVLAAVAHVARTLAALMTALLQVAAAVMSALFVTAVAAVVILAFLVHL